MSVLRQVFEFVKLAELYYAGSHGMDIKGPAKASRHNKAKVSILHCRTCQPQRGKAKLIFLCFCTSV